MKLDDAPPPTADGAQSKLDPTELARNIAPLNKRISVAVRQGKSMPYDMKNLPDAVKTLSKAKRNKWLTVFNAAIKNYQGEKDAESKSFGAAWSAVGGKSGKLHELAEWDAAYINNLPDSSFAVVSKGGSKDKEGKTVPRDLRHLPYKNADGSVNMAHLRNALSRLPQTDLSDEEKATATKKLEAAAKEKKVGDQQAHEGDYMGRILHAYELSGGARRLMLFPRGTFVHPEYGEMKFDDAFFDEIISNYENKALGNTKPFVDVDHDHGAACAWMEGLAKEPDGLYATVDWTSLGEELIATGQYRYFSPWWGPYKDPGTGKLYERVLRGGALTNIPFLKVLPAVELYEPGKLSAARTRAFKSGVQFKLAETTAISLPPGTSVNQASDMVRAAFNDQFSPRVSQMPMSSPYWIYDIYDDHVIACYDSGPGYGPKYYSLPYTMEDDGITFHPDQQVEVHQVWEPVAAEAGEPMKKPFVYNEAALNDLRTRYGAGRAVAQLLAERRQDAFLHTLAERTHGTK